MATKNISKEKREALRIKIKTIKEALMQGNNGNVEELVTYLGQIEDELIKKRFGLVFEEHKEEVDYLLENNIPILVEDKQLAVSNGGLQNFIIEGDNLGSLNMLNRTHRGKIDVIYIDPPYNTGNKDFIYDDSYVDNVDTFKHSKWLSFMKKRLELAVELLKEDGIIFISIDDNEAANLKVLCDQIFNEDNYIAEFSRKVSASPRMDAKHIAIGNDKILVYAKNKNSLVITKKESETYLNNPSAQKDDHFEERGYFILNKLDRGSINYSKTCDYPIITPTGETIYPGGDYEKWKQRQNGVFNKKDWCWRWNKAKLEWGIANDYIVFKNNAVYFKQYEKVDNSLNPIVRENVYSNLLDDSAFFNDTAKKEITAIFNKAPFDYPKPVGLIKFLINLHPNKNAMVLDFFAGSGTTGQATLEINEEDHGQRKFILCTNNQNGICENVTYQRIKTVITGERLDGSVYSEGIAASLKYMKMDFIDRSEAMYYEYADELLLHIRELVELENAIDFDKNNSIKIILNDEEADSQINESMDKSVKIIYLGHNVLLTSEQEKIIEKNNIVKITIPEYYYSEVND